MSADFRLRDVDVYERWYGLPHPARELTARAVYALPELHAEQVRGADLLAAPGCYPTAALLATSPALLAGLVEPEVIIDAKSGVSGAGRSASLGTHFSEVNESVHAYGVDGHRHSAEMLQEMSLAAGTAVRVTFVAHLIPMTRGLLATAYLRPRPGVSREQLHAVYAEFCDGRPFLRLDARPPATKSVSGTNLAALHVGWQDGTAVVVCAEDNLLKGGAGQAVQAMNLRFGLGETSGLPMSPQWP
jgi:N-acetyl-gamma-glutamyl-phosphate reductase